MAQQGSEDPLSAELSAIISEMESVQGTSPEAGNAPFQHAAGAARPSAAEQSAAETAPLQDAAEATRPSAAEQSTAETAPPETAAEAARPPAVERSSAQAAYSRRSSPYPQGRRASRGRASPTRGQASMPYPFDRVRVSTQQGDHVQVSTNQPRLAEEGFSARTAGGAPAAAERSAALSEGIGSAQLLNQVVARLAQQ